jgi:hypothetical protein
MMPAFVRTLAALLGGVILLALALVGCGLAWLIGHLL